MEDPTATEAHTVGMAMVDLTAVVTEEAMVAVVTAVADTTRSEIPIRQTGASTLRL